MSGSMQPDNPANGQTTRVPRKQSRKRRANKPARPGATAPGVQPRTTRQAGSRALPAGADFPMPTKGGAPLLMINLVQVLPAAGSVFTKEQRDAWLKAADANLAVAYPTTKAA